MYQPLADKARPTDFDQVVGQTHLLGENGMLTKIIRRGTLPNLIFFGPPGTGKTTTAAMIASHTHRKFYRLNATTASLSDVKSITQELDTLMAPDGVLLYLDEIQYFNKKQQQSLLEFIENGKLTLIASTTENPYFYVYPALLSRTLLFEFKPLTPDDIIAAVERALQIWSQEAGPVSICREALQLLASACQGDVRKAINLAEILANTAAKNEQGIFSISADDVKQAASCAKMQYDRDGDSHFDLLSAFHKSLRGSDPNAAVYYLAKALEASDILSVSRRMLAMACEDVGLAYPNAIVIVKACVDSALQLGLPEARLPLAQAAILLATAPKSNSAACAIDSAMEDIKNGQVYEIPNHLKDAHYPGASALFHGTAYQYPHDFPNHWVAQQYLPSPMKNKQYYQFGDNKLESAARQYWEAICKKSSKQC